MTDSTGNRPQPASERKRVLPAAPGDVIAGKYEIVRLLGRGGMGVVFEARHVEIGNRVAIKFLKQEVAQDATILMRFRREARAAGAVESEHIARVFDLGEDDAGTPFIVMEFISGRTLRSILNEDGALPIRRAVALTRQICRALSSAHRAGILHRDIKPENLLLTSRSDGGDWIKIVDFGVARLNEGHNLTTLTTTAGTPGTAHYLAPELIRGSRDFDERTDLYAVAVVLYELLTLQRPHSGRSYDALLYHIVHEPPRPLRELRPTVPEALAAMVEAALSPDPERRPRTALEFLIELEPFEQDDGANVSAATATSTHAGTAAGNEEDAQTTLGIGPTLPSTETRSTLGVASETAPPAPGRRAPTRPILWATVLLLGGGLAWYGFRPPPNGAVLDAPEATVAGAGLGLATAATPSVETDSSSDSDQAADTTRQPTAVATTMPFPSATATTALHAGSATRAEAPPARPKPRRIPKKTTAKPVPSPKPTEGPSEPDFHRKNPYR